MLISILAASSVQAAPRSPSSGNGALHASPATQVQDEILVHTSNLLREGKFRQAAQLLESKPVLRCDPRMDLLLAAAQGDAGDTPAAKRTLEKAHLVWPSNINLATSLARYELQEGKPAAAEQVIRPCKATSSTPLRELQVMAMAYLENHDLARAKSIAVMAFRAYPSEETLLFTANILQLQGRFMNVVVLLRKY